MSGEGCSPPKEQLLDDQPRANRDILFIGRTDYHLHIHTPSASSAIFLPSMDLVSQGAGRETPGVQKIFYSTYTSNTYDRPLADYWAKVGLAEQRWDARREKRLRVELGHDEAAVGIEQGGVVRWETKLGSIG